MLFVKVLFVFFVLDYISLFLCRLSFVGLVFLVPSRGKSISAMICFCQMECKTLTSQSLSLVFICVTELYITYFVKSFDL